jgi:hypothetical protein
VAIDRTKRPQHLNVSELKKELMKRHLQDIVLTAGLSVLLGSSTLSAQSQKAVANIPFAYHVGENTLPAGTYTIAKSSSSQSVFALRETDTGHEIFVPVVQQDTGAKNAWNLSFSCYAGECSLSQIRMAGDSYNLTARPPVRLASNRIGLAAMISVPLR